MSGATASLPMALRVAATGSGGSTPSASQSTLAASPWAFDANGIATSTVTVTTKDAGGTLLPDIQWTASVETTAVSAALSVVSASPSTIEDNGTDVCTVTLTVSNAAGQPLAGIPASRCVLAVSGTGNTVTQPTGFTDRNGQISGSFTSTVAANKTASFTVHGLAITDTALVEVTGIAPPETVLADVQWTTATGTTQSALQDDSNVQNGNAYALGSGGPIAAGEAASWGCPLTHSVVDGPTLGWSGGGNVYLLTMTGGCSHLQFPFLFPLPDVTDQYWSFRYYAMNGAGQTDFEMHPHCFWPTSVDGGPIEGVHMQVDPSQATGGDWSPVCSLSFGSAFPFGAVPKVAPAKTTRVVLSAAAWHRYEIIMHWRNATEFRVYPRLYDTDDTTLLADATNFCHTDTTESLQDWYDASASNWFTRNPTSTDPDRIRTLSFGNGQSKTNGNSYGVAAFKAKLGISDSDFVGAV